MLKMILRIFVFIIFFSLVVPVAFAQENSDQLPNGRYKPEFIMSHQQELGMTDDQRQRIMKEVMELQVKIPQLPDGPEKMKLFLGTVTRINDVLTPEQKEILKKLQSQGESASSGPNTPQLFIRPQRVVIQGYSEVAAMEPFISRDGKYLFFNNSNGKPGTDTHLFYATRINDTTFQLVGSVKGLDASLRAPDINSAAPSLDTNGNIYFTTNRSYHHDFNVIHHGLFNNGTVTGVAPVTGISRKQPGWINMDGEISEDGRTLYYSDNSEQVSIIKVASKNADGSFSPLANSDDLLKNVNNADHNYAPSSSKDGLELFFTRAMAGGIYVVKRSSTSEPFGVPQLAVSAADGPVEAPSISSDGTHLYYAKKDGADPYSWSIYVATRGK